MQSKFMRNNKKMLLLFAPVATMSGAMRLLCRAISPSLLFCIQTKTTHTTFTSLNCLSFSVFVFGVP